MLIISSHRILPLWILWTGLTNKGCFHMREKYQEINPDQETVSQTLLHLLFVENDATHLHIIFFLSLACWRFLTHVHKCRRAICCLPTALKYLDQSSGSRAGNVRNKKLMSAGKHFSVRWRCHDWSWLASISCVSSDWRRGCGRRSEPVRTHTHKHRQHLRMVACMQEGWKLPHLLKKK